MSRAPRRVGIATLAAALAGFAGGCSGRDNVPVRGRVVWEDDTPATELAGGAVEFESADGRRSARGEIASDATFALSSAKPGDGVPLGDYRAVVVPPPPPGEQPVRIIDKQFMSYRTSGLTYTVGPEKNDGVVFKVRRGKP